MTLEFQGIQIKETDRPQSPLGPALSLIVIDRTGVETGAQVEPVGPVIGPDSERGFGTRV